MYPSNDGIVALCPSFAESRKDLLADVSSSLQPLGYADLSNDALLQILLYGDEDFPDDLNKDILLSTLLFVHRTGGYD